jgi:hypothetical protein
MDGHIYHWMFGSPCQVLRWTRTKPWEQDTPVEHGPNVGSPTTAKEIPIVVLVV